MRLQELSETECHFKMQFVCEDRLHKSQVGAVGSSLGSYPRGRQFESGTLQHHFLGDTKVMFISFLVIIERHIVRENSMPFKRFYGVTVAQEILVLLETVRVGLELLFLGKYIFYV